VVARAARPIGDEDIITRADGSDPGARRGPPAWFGSARWPPRVHREPSCWLRACKLGRGHDEYQAEPGQATS